MLNDIGKILAILDGLDSTDRATAIAVITARYGGHMTSSNKKTSKGRGGDGKPASAGASLKKDAPKDAGDGVQHCFLEETALALEPVLKDLPMVSRQEGAAKPHMTLKSVQKRLNTKRKELQKELQRLVEEPLESYHVYKSLNAIQAFRIAARDAARTKGTRLATNPIPKGFDSIRGRLRALSVELVNSKEVQENGFFSDVSGRFDSYLELKESADTTKQSDLIKDSPW